MGTRADFYVGRGAEAEWLGSIAWDGYPDGEPETIVPQTTEATYREKVTELLNRDESASTPEDGWPWPWDDSGTTDYAYAFDDGSVWSSCYGGPWFLATEPEDDPPGEPAMFPDMTTKKNVVEKGQRSGLITVERGPDGIDEVS